MEKRYQVFVSSTYRDLKEARATVIQALLELDCIPAGMELFPASDESQWDLIKRVIDDCDYYIVIIAGVYGSTDEAGISYTEKEYDYAVSQQKPVLAFPHEDPTKIPSGNVELSEAAQAKLKAFREKATKDKMAKFWNSAEDLGAKVSRSLVQTLKVHPAEGWIQARFASNPERIVELQRRIDELQVQLDAARTTPPAGIETLAHGGDQCVVEYEVTARHGEDAHRQIAFTWDGIVAVLGPLMFDGCQEARLMAALQEEVRLRVMADHPRHIFARVLKRSFQTIKVQLIALGLMKKSDRKRAPSDKETYWSLTAYGEHYVTKLVAVRRGGV
jgi:hypothetical protein